MSSHCVNEFPTKSVWLRSGQTDNPRRSSSSSVRRDNLVGLLLIEPLNLFFSIIHDTIALNRRGSRDEGGGGRERAARVKPSKICSRRVMKVCLINSHPGSRRFHASQRRVSRLPFIPRICDSPRPSQCANCRETWNREKKKEKKKFETRRRARSEAIKLVNRWVFSKFFSRACIWKGTILVYEIEKRWFVFFLFSFYANTRGFVHII